MCQATIKRQSNHFESCQVQKVASLLTEALTDPPSHAGWPPREAASPGSRCRARDLRGSNPVPKGPAIRYLLQAYGELAQAEVVQGLQQLWREVPVDLSEADLRSHREVQGGKSVSLRESVEPAIVASRHQTRAARILCPVAPIVHAPEVAFQT